MGVNKSSHFAVVSKGAHKIKMLFVILTVCSSKQSITRDKELTNQILALKADFTLTKNFATFVKVLFSYSLKHQESPSKSLLEMLQLRYNV